MHQNPRGLTADTSRARRLKSSHREEAMSVVLVHVHIHHLQQILHFLEVHPAVIVLIGLLEPVTDPSGYAT